MKTRRIFFNLFLLTFVFAFVSQAFGDETAVITQGYEAHEADLIGVRFRSFANTGGSEMYTGIPNLGGGPNRVEADLNWEDENSITFTFDADADKLVAAVTNAQGTTTIAYEDLSEILAKKNFAYTTADLNVMQITLANRDKDSLVIFSDVELNDQSLGSFSDTGWNDWMVSGLDFSQGFTLTGTIQLSGAFSNSQEKSKIEIKVGYSSNIVTTSEPTATNTTVPTATNTPEPTATNTVAPTSTNTTMPTATNTPEPTATNTVEPTATNTSEPDVDNAEAPTVTATPSPVVTIIPGPAMTTTPESPSNPTDSVETTSYQIFIPLIIDSSN